MATRRSITDEEIGFIKTMLARGMRNRDIQFFFNRQDRPVNSGRISQIRSGTYGRELPAADDASVDAFLAEFVSADVGVVVGDGVAGSRKSIDQIAQERFKRRGDGYWYLTDGETSDQECKESFHPRRMNPIIKAIAALANNQGGYVFIGVSNDDCRAVGLPDAAFQDTDIVTITDKVKTFLTPTPLFSKHIIDLDDVQIGIIHVQKYNVPPIIVCRDGDGLEDGAILFRYPGQSARIKYGDLHAMLRERDRSAQVVLLSRATRLSEIGTDDALILDARHGTLDAGDAQITIDRELADQLDFIREGEFKEVEASPALRLVGDVKAVDNTGRLRERVEARAITADMVVKAYLQREQVRSPVEYIRVSAQVQRQWLPLHYFVRLSGRSVQAAIQALESTVAVYKSSKERGLERLKGRRSAYQALSGKAISAGSEIQSGEIQGVAERHQPAHVCRAIQGLPNNFDNIPPLLDLLSELLDTFHGNAVVRGYIYRAASRLDEIEAHWLTSRS